MPNKEEETYSIREIVHEIIKNKEGMDVDVHDDNNADYESIMRMGNRYYEAYKKMECVTDFKNGVEYVTYASDKEMVSANIQKMFDNPEYVTFVNHARKKNFSFEKFLQLMKKPRNREIFKDLYLDSLHKLDVGYYCFAKEDVDLYIENVEYDGSIEKWDKLKDNLNTLVQGIFSIKNKVDRDLLMDELEKSMEKVAIEAMERQNRENYLNRIKTVIPLFRLVTRVEELPTELFQEYVKYNGYEGFDVMGKISYDENGFPQDNITDEMIIEIKDKHYDILEKNKIISEIQKILD